MKKNFFSLLLAFCISSMIFISCQKDEPVTETDARLDYIGQWLCTENGGMTYTVKINLDSATQTQIKLYNFHNLGMDEKANGIVTGNSMNIPNQSLCQGTIQISGSGVMLTNKSSIEFTYTVNDGANLDTIYAAYTKQ